jgi:tetratricopeptide (TPR) repeat protein
MMRHAKIPVATLAALVLTVLLALTAVTVSAHADQTDPRLDDLFARLQEDGLSEAEAGEIQKQIWDIWTSIDDVRADSLMSLGIANMAGGDYEGAVRSFTVLIEKFPEFAEAWNKRATVYYLMGEYEASLADVRRTLVLEPRHFGALSGLGLIFYQFDEYKKAIAAYEAALEVNPHAPGAKENLEKLRKLEEGQPT